MQEIENHANPGVRAQRATQSCAEILAPTSADTRVLSPPTSVIQDPPFGPMLDNHRQGTYSFVDLHVSLDHSRILQRQSIVNVHVTGQFEFGIPDFDNRDFGMWYTYHSLHSVCTRSATSRGITMIRSILTVRKRFGEKTNLLECSHRCCDAYVHCSDQLIDTHHRILVHSPSESLVHSMFPEDPNTWTLMSFPGHCSFRICSNFCLNLALRSSLSLDGSIRS